MKITDEKLLDKFRGPGRCELCGKSCQRREPHHVIAKGMGGGRRLDIRINIVACGSTQAFECRCHTMIDTKEGQERCWRIIAAREGTTVEAIIEACYTILNIDKDASQDRIKEKIGNLDAEPWALARRALITARKLSDEGARCTRRSPTVRGQEDPDDHHEGEAGEEVR